MATNPLTDPGVTAALAQIKAKQPLTAATLRAGLSEWYTGPQGPLSSADLLRFGLNLADQQGFAAQAKVIRDFVTRTKPTGILDTGVQTTDITGFLSALVNPHTWLRVAEVGIGLLLVAVGVAKLTGVVPAATKIATTKIATTVGKLPI